MIMENESSSLFHCGQLKFTMAVCTGLKDNDAPAAQVKHQATSVQLSPSISSGFFLDSTS